MATRPSTRTASGVVNDLNSDSESFISDDEDILIESDAEQDDSNEEVISEAALLADNEQGSEVSTCSRSTTIPSLLDVLCALCAVIMYS